MCEVCGNNPIEFHLIIKQMGQNQHRCRCCAGCRSVFGTADLRYPGLVVTEVTEEEYDKAVDQPVKPEQN
jgi:hypothetical protein